MDEPDDLADEAEAPADARDLYANLGRACSTSPRFRSGRPSSPRNGNGTLLLLDARSRSRSPSPAVGRDATDEDIKRAYLNLAQVAHPDKHASPAMREVRLSPLASSP